MLEIWPTTYYSHFHVQFQIIFSRTVKPLYNDHHWHPKMYPPLTSGCCHNIIYVIRLQCGPNTVGVLFRRGPLDQSSLYNIMLIQLNQFQVLTFLIIVNMYIAVILENYSQANEDVQVNFLAIFSYEQLFHKKVF